MEYLSGYRVLNSINGYLNDKCSLNGIEEELNTLNELYNNKTKMHAKKISDVMDVFLIDFRKIIIERTSESGDGAFLDILTHERQETEFSSTSVEFIERFLKDYNSKVVEILHNYIRWLKEKLTNLFFPYFTESDFAGLLVNDSFNEWYYWFSDEEVWRKKRQEDWFYKTNTYLPKEDNDKISPRLKLFYSNYSEEISIDSTTQTPDEIFKIFKYNLKAKFRKWFQKANNPFLTEADFLEIQITKIQFEISDLSKKNKWDTELVSMNNASQLAFNKVQLSICETRLAEFNNTKKFSTVAAELSLEIKSTRQEIIKRFESLGKNCFRNSDEYNLFVEILTNFFDKVSYKLPTKNILLKRLCKTKVATIFAPIYHQKYTGPLSLKSNAEYFKIIKILNDFSDKTDEDIYRDINR